MIPCLKCGAATKVKDSRLTNEKTTVRRRRNCACGNKFTTYEVVEFAIPAIPKEELLVIASHAKLISESVASIQKTIEHPSSFTV